MNSLTGGGTDYEYIYGSKSAKFAPGGASLMRTQAPRLPPPVKRCQSRPQKKRIRSRVRHRTMLLLLFSQRIVQSLDRTSHRTVYPAFRQTVRLIPPTRGYGLASDPDGACDRVDVPRVSHLPRPAQDSLGLCRVPRVRIGIFGRSKEWSCFTFCELQKNALARTPCSAAKSLLLKSCASCASCMSFGSWQ